MAQLVERVLGKDEVSSSILDNGSTKARPLQSTLQGLFALGRWQRQDAQAAAMLSQIFGALLANNF